MNLEDVDKKRLEDIIRCGVDDYELRQFFSENRKQLIMKGAKVQNLPHGNTARVSAVLNLPTEAISIFTSWLSKNLKMIDPEPVEDIIELLKLYEEEGEKINERDAKRVFRSCLVHLVSQTPNSDLIDFLRAPIGGYLNKKPGIKDEPVAEGVIDPSFAENVDCVHLTDAIIALLEGRDPDDKLSTLPADVSSILSALHSSTNGQTERATSIIENSDIGDADSIRTLITLYAKRVLNKINASRQNSPGICIIQPVAEDEPEFDFDTDHIIGKCKKDYPETAVFVEPFAILKGDGKLVSLEDELIRSKIFPISGDVQAFTGAGYPKQPRRGEIGIWRVQPNDQPGTSDRRNNFHLIGQKVNIYEVCHVPFSSKDYESVREYIKLQLGDVSKRQTEPLIFVLRDGLIIGVPSGRDLTRDDGFDEGLPCWNRVDAFRFEGRVLVYSPLPASYIYECGTLGSSLKKYFESVKFGSDKLTKAQRKNLTDWVSKGEGELTLDRRERLLRELKAEDYGDDAIEVILDVAMQNASVKNKIDSQIQKIVRDQTEQKGKLLAEIEALEAKLAQVKDSIDGKLKELHSLPAAILKAVKTAVRHAEEDTLNTLGNALVFKALIGEGGVQQNSQSANDICSRSIPRMDWDCDPEYFLRLTSTLNLSRKHIKSLETVEKILLQTGLILVLEGISANLIAEGLGRSNKNGCRLIECSIGMPNGELIAALNYNDGRAIILKDANLSPMDVYARSLLDMVQKRIINRSLEDHSLIVVTVSDSFAGLPVPKIVNALSLQVSLDNTVEFMRESDVEEIFDSVDEGEDYYSCIERLWHPAQTIFLEKLRNLSPGEAALILSLLR